MYKKNTFFTHFTCREWHWWVYKQKIKRSVKNSILNTPKKWDQLCWTRLEVKKKERRRSRRDIEGLLCLFQYKQWATAAEEREIFHIRERFYNRDFNCLCYCSISHDMNTFFSCTLRFILRYNHCFDIKTTRVLPLDSNLTLKKLEIIINGEMCEKI